MYVWILLGYIQNQQFMKRAAPRAQLIFQGRGVGGVPHPLYRREEVVGECGGGGARSFHMRKGGDGMGEASL